MIITNSARSLAFDIQRATHRVIQAIMQQNQRGSISSESFCVLPELVKFHRDPKTSKSERPRCDVAFNI